MLHAGAQPYQPLLPRWVQAVYQTPAPHNTCGSCWLETAQQFYNVMRGEDGSRVTSKLKQGAPIHQRQFSHDMRREGGSWVWCICASCLISTVLLHKEFEIPTECSTFFEILKFVFLSEVADKSFCVKFSALISKLKILDKSYPRIFNVQTNIWSLFRAKRIMVRQWSLSNYFASKTQKFRCVIIFLSGMQ